MNNQTTDVLDLEHENATMQVKVTYLQEILKGNAFHTADRKCLKHAIEKLGREKSKAEKKLVGVEKDCRELVMAIKECGDMIQGLELENRRLDNLVEGLKMCVPDRDVYEDPREENEREIEAFVEYENVGLNNLAEDLRDKSAIEKAGDEADQSDEELRIAVERGVAAADLQTAESETWIGQVDLAGKVKQSVSTTTPECSGGLSIPAKFEECGKFELPPTPMSMDSQTEPKKTVSVVTGAPIPFPLSKLRDSGIQNKDEKSARSPDTESLYDVSELRSIGLSEKKSGSD